MIPRFLYRALNPARALLQRTRHAPIAYATAAPSPQLALDLFKGEWASSLPPPWSACTAGKLPLFADPRLMWGIARLGGVGGQRVLELGPLDGLHTYLLEQQGAREVIAIEAHPRSFLRCLVVKEILGLTRSHFQHGDFVAFLRQPREPRFDLAVASGVLYHMENPIELVAGLAGSCQAVYLWTHYYDHEQVRQRPNIAARLGVGQRRTTLGFEHTIYPFQYSAERFRDAFYGGPKNHANWLTRDDILRALGHFGFTDIEENEPDVTHPHGPALTLIARRKRDSARP